MTDAQAVCGQAQQAENFIPGDIVCPNCDNTIPKAMGYGSEALLDANRLPNWVRDKFQSLDPGSRGFLRSHPQIEIWKEYIDEEEQGLRLDFLPLLCSRCKKQITIRS
jgi:hypothetical protein